MPKIIQTETAPAAVGPYSQAVVHDGLVWISGQIPLDARTGSLIEGGIAAETRQALRNLLAVLEAAGSDVTRVVRTTVYLTDLGDFETVNGVYAEVFRDSRPARACVEVSGLPKGAHVEIDAIAVVG